MPPIKTDAPHGVLPHLQMKTPLKNKPSPLRCEAPFHEMIPRKSTNNNLKSSWNPWKNVWRRSFLVNLQACRLIASNFNPCIDSSPPPIKFWTASPYLPMRGGHSPHALNTCGKPWGVNTMKTFKLSCFDTIYNRSYLNLNPLNAMGIYIRPSMVISMTTNVLHEQPWVYIYVRWLFVLWILDHCICYIGTYIYRPSSLVVDAKTAWHSKG